jgi:hypothetical protein
MSQLFNQGSHTARSQFSSAFNLEYHQSEETRAERSNYLTPGFAATQRNSSDEDFFLDEEIDKADKQGKLQSHQGTFLLDFQRRADVRAVRQTDEETFVADMIHKQIQAPHITQTISYQTKDKSMCAEEGALRELVSMGGKVVLVEKVTTQADGGCPPRRCAVLTRAQTDGSISVKYRTSMAPEGSTATTTIPAPTKDIPYKMETVTQDRNRKPYRAPRRMGTIDRELLDRSHITSYRTSCVAPSSADADSYTIAETTTITSCDARRSVYMMLLH